MNRSRHLFKWAFSFVVGMLMLTPALAQTASNSVTPGQFVVEPPTLQNLGFEWYIDGDANRNATVTVIYKKASDTSRVWKQGLHLLRIQNEVNDQGAGGVYTAPNMFAGSVLDLDPDTDYQVMLTMQDPDGVNGNPTQTALVHTRPVPKPFVVGNVRRIAHVRHARQRRRFSAARQ